ncbi:MAG TPA: helix-turn-helix transcriptional regulator [Sphingobium sp.]
MENDIARLTEVQKKILRLVAEAKTSKEIAIETDLTPMTVDQYIHRAMNILGATGRREAARQLVEWESSNELRRFEFKSSLLAEPQETANPPVTVRSSNWLAALRLPPTGGKPNDLDSVTRLFAIFRIALVSTVVAIAIIIIAKGAFILLS